MKNISPSLQAFLLNSESFNRADLISIVLPNGQVISALAGNNMTQITYPAGGATSITVGGADYPWSPADPTYGFPTSSGSSPTSIAMVPGQTITLLYTSGTVSPHLGSILVTPDGGFGTQPTPENFPGSYITSPAFVQPWCLIGGFANAAGALISPPFYIGTNAVIGPAPTGTTQLVMGVNDYPYSDNTGSWTMAIGSPTYYATKYGTWERGAYTNQADFKINTGSMDLIGYIPSTVMYPGTSTPLIQSLDSLVGSRVTIQTLFWPLGSPPSSGFSMGTMQLTTGQIGNVKNTSGSKITCEMFDLTYILNRPFPPHMIQSSCRHTFCDSGCTLQINNFRTTPYGLDSGSTTLYLDFTVPLRANTTSYNFGNIIITSSVIYMCTTKGTSAGFAPAFNQPRGETTTDGGVVWTSMGSIVAGTLPANQSFPLGYVLGVTGQNAGFKRAIKVQTVTTGGLLEIQLLWSLPFPITAGDTFRLNAGCDKTLGTCEIIYLNEIHYGGMPFVPNPEIAA